MMRIYQTRPGWLPADAPYEIEVVCGNYANKAEQVRIVLRDAPLDAYGRKTTAPRTRERNCAGLDEGIAQQLMETPLAMLLAMDRLKGEPWAADFDFQRWEKERAFDKAAKRNRNR